MSHNLDSRPLHLVIDLDIALRRAEVLMSGKLHNHLGRDAAVRELGDKAAPPAVAGRTLDASLPIQLSKQLAERSCREGGVLQWVQVPPANYRSGRKQTETFPRGVLFVI